MNIQSDIPEIFALRKSVEKRLGERLITHSDFLNLVAIIEMEQRQYISESTLERLWGYSTRGYATVSIRTLDVLATYAAGCLWQEFYNTLKSEATTESEYFSITNIHTSELRPNDRVLFGWLPNRQCSARYLGKNRFIAEECLNSKIQPGDTFQTLQFTLGKELQMSLFRQASAIDSTPKTYIVGTTNGLTMLKILHGSDSESQ